MDVNGLPALLHCLFHALMFNSILTKWAETQGRCSGHTQTTEVLKTQQTTSVEDTHRHKGCVEDTHTDTRDVLKTHTHTHTDTSTCGETHIA